MTAALAGWLSAAWLVAVVLTAYAAGHVVIPYRGRHAPDATTATLTDLMKEH